MWFLQMYVRILFSRIVWCSGHMFLLYMLGLFGILTSDDPLAKILPTVAVIFAIGVAFTLMAGVGAYWKYEEGCARRDNPEEPKPARVLRQEDYTFLDG